MLTMQKEKVNTHFSFPLKLDMSGYVEKSLMPQQYHDRKKKLAEKKARTLSGDLENDLDDEMIDPDGDDDIDAVDEYCEQNEYKLIGVTVHTGNADGGHYYSFIKERNALHGDQQDRWFLFNDAEVKQFDPSQIEAECFGGEMTSKTYDTIAEKYLDFSFEKTNSAYMLFYERCSPQKYNEQMNLFGTAGSYEMEYNTVASSSVDKLSQMPCCSTTVVNDEKMSDAQQQQQQSLISTKTSMRMVDNVMDVVVDENEKNIELNASAVIKKQQLSKEPHETDSNTEIVLNNCDIDNKNEITCNGNINILSPKDAQQPTTTAAISLSSNATAKTGKYETKISLNRELEEWIWEDNRVFLQDRNIFEHTYFK